MWLRTISSTLIGQGADSAVFISLAFAGILPGAVLATIGIFLPSFAFVALSHPFIPRMRASAVAGSLLDGINAGALGLMAAVALQLGQAAITDWLTVLLAIASAAALLRWKVNATWLILGGGAIGLAARLILL